MSATEIKSKMELVRQKIVFSHTSHYKSLSESKYKVFNLDNMDGKPFIAYLEKYSVKLAETRKARSFSEQSPRSSIRNWERAEIPEKSGFLAP